MLRRIILERGQRLTDADLARSGGVDAEIIGVAAKIVDDVRQRGDDAVRELTAKFDKAELGKDSPPCVPIAELVPALERANLAKEVTDAFDVALSNIVRFHEAQRQADLTLETMPGVSCRRVTRAINRVGVYVPGGHAVSELRDEEP